MIMIETHSKGTVHIDKPTKKSSTTRSSTELQTHASERIVVRKKAKQLREKIEFKADCVTHCK